jgi:hypothetical protein
MLTQAATYFNFFNFLVACPKDPTRNLERGRVRLSSAPPQLKPLAKIVIE